MTQTVLVTGATGLLGANIVEQLNLRGYNVRILARKSSSFKALQGLDYELIYGDLTQTDSLKQALHGVDYVIHSAALTATANVDFEQFFLVNTKATKDLVDLAKKQGIKRFVYVSTANCFTNGTKQQPGTEEGGFMQWLVSSKYAYTKYLAQEYVLEQAQQGFPGLVVAPTFLIGPRDSKPSSGRLLLYAVRNKILFYPPGGKSFIDVRLAAEAVVNALEKGRIGQTYLLAGENLTYKEFFEKVAHVLQQKKLYVPVPKVVLASVAYLMEFLKVFGVKTLFDRTNQRLLTIDNYFSNQKAQGELGLKPTKIEEAIKAAIEWFEQNGYWGK